MLTNYVQLLLYISYEQSDLYILVSTMALLVATTSTQVNQTWYIICDCLSENQPSSHLPVFREIPF